MPKKPAIGFVLDQVHVGPTHRFAAADRGLGARRVTPCILIRIKDIDANCGSLAVGAYRGD